MGLLLLQGSGQGPGGGLLPLQGRGEVLLPPGKVLLRLGRGHLGLGLGLGVVPPLAQGFHGRDVVGLQAVPLLARLLQGFLGPLRGLVGLPQSPLRPCGGRVGPGKALPGGL